MEIFFLLIIVLLIGIDIRILIHFSRTLRQWANQAEGVKKPILAWSFICASLLMLAVAFGTSLHTWWFTRTAQHTTGTVTELRERSGSSTGLTYAPTFRFADTTGVEHAVFSSSSSSPPEFRVGERVTVLFHPDNPKNARIDTFWQVWGDAFGFAIIGGAFLPVGLIMLNWPRIVARFKRTALASAT